MKLSLKETILAGIFAALTAVLAQISIPIPISPVPITLSIFGVFLSALVLGTKYGTLSQLAYVLLGAVGVPVFAGFNGGLGIILSPKGGYIISYPIMALVIGIIIEHKKTASVISMTVALLVSLIVCYSIGASWLAAATGMSAAKAISAGVAPFLPLDILKAAAGAVLGYQVKQALHKSGLISSKI